MTLGKPVNLSEALFPHLLNENNDSIPSQGHWEDKIIHLKVLRIVLDTSTKKNGSNYFYYEVLKEHKPACLKICSLSIASTSLPETRLPGFDHILAL